MRLTRTGYLVILAFCAFVWATCKITICAYRQQTANSHHELEESNYESK